KRSLPPRRLPSSRFPASGTIQARSSGRVGFDVAELARVAGSYSINALLLDVLRVDDRLEAAVDHALAVEWHGSGVGLHARVSHHLLPALDTSLLRRPFRPGEDDDLVVPGLYRAPVVGQLALRHVVSPRFDDARGAALLEHHRGH